MNNHELKIVADCISKIDDVRENLDSILPPGAKQIKISPGRIVRVIAELRDVLSAKQTWAKEEVLSIVTECIEINFPIHLRSKSPSASRQKIEKPNCL